MLKNLGAETMALMTLGMRAKIPGQSMYVWEDREAWSNFLATMGYR
ncbi:hypothetical protein [Streptomyces sp. NPDC005476]